MEKVYIGKIVNTHGIKGELRILSDFEFKDKAFKVNTEIYIDNEKHIIKSYRRHKNYDMITIDNYNNINDVLYLLKKKVYKKKNELDLSDEEILDSDLLTYKVIDKNKNCGIIKEIFLASPTNKIIRVLFDKEVLIPINSPMIKKIDKKLKIVEVELIDGMIYMKIDILSLFPDMFNGVFTESIIKRAIKDKKVNIEIHNFRDYTTDPHNKVDDTPYGGGCGMVLMAQPIFDCVESLKKEESKVILLTPSGIPYKQKIAYDLSKEKHLIIICGHYEGFDERIRTLADLEISIGDYVLTGGEIPAMVLVDSITRLLPGVIKERSHLEDSFNDNYLLDYPTYTKPRIYKGMEVPEVLLSGDHKKIDEYRKQESIRKTKELRPDLLKK